ncbi:TetR/AcrR family transcriptional regulator [Embleya sp. NBC_00896]|uniref:TetR/AcrR family transcriptional regulator n=1 Tax=Embleya sp. NBC_00896 TaxID=2975961 RepID=UPI003865DE6D|nr:TetR/AcrR family transcriptional regulator [Embleya sp. NBC_00896]
MSASPTDGRVRKGDRTRLTIVRRAADIASLEGLEGLSIGRLAGDLEISKSGVFAHFGSKEELQLAAIAAASDVFVEHVLTPVRATPPGLIRLWQLVDRWIAYSRDRVFPGGCFFFHASAEFDGRPGRVRDSLAEAWRLWRATLTREIEAAKRAGAAPADLDSAQLVFEIIAFLETANGVSVLHDDTLVYERAATAVRSRLLSASTDPTTLAAELTP